jgi:hypothetical protein
MPQNPVEADNVKRASLLLNRFICVNFDLSYEHGDAYGFLGFVQS